MKLQKCCDCPEDESIKDDPCQSHLEGFESKEGKEKHEAFKCFAKCVYESRKLFVGGNLDKDKIIEYTEGVLSKHEEFKDISMTSIEYCYNECK